MERPVLTPTERVAIMAIDFELTPEQKKLKYDTREFALEVVKPCAEKGDRETDAQKAFGAMMANRRSW